MNSENMQLLEIPVKTLDGRIIRLGDLTSDKPVYIKFWATWCQPCREQMPHLKRIFAVYKEKMDIIAVNLDVNESVEAVIDTKKEFDLAFPIVIDHTAKLARNLDVEATPFHVLLDIKRNIVHQGYDASEALDEKIKNLSGNTPHRLPLLKTGKNHPDSPPLETLKDGPTVLFFASAWCDWYLENRRPQMAGNCVKAQALVNSLYAKHPNLNWHGVLTRLWTGQKELAEYKKKYDIKHPLAVDTSNAMFYSYGVKSFPTLIVFNEGKEIARWQDFSDSKTITDIFQQFGGL